MSVYLQDKIGFYIENDLKWDYRGWDRSTQSYSRFMGSIEDLVDLETPNVDEYYKRRNILNEFELSPEMRAWIEEFAELARDTQEAARNKDIERVRDNYRKFGEMKKRVPYNSQAVAQATEE
jgi:hypothetical protein